MHPFMKALTLVLLLIVCVHCQNNGDQSDSEGVLSLPRVPSEEKSSWNITSPVGTTITLACKSMTPKQQSLMDTFKNSLTWTLMLILSLHCHDKGDYSLVLEPGSEAVLHTPVFDTVPNKNQRINWNITSPAGTTIALSCKTKMPNKNCDQGNMYVIDTGKLSHDFCAGVEGDVEITTDDNFLQVIFMIKWYHAVAGCTARASTAETPSGRRKIKRIVDLVPGDDVYQLRRPVSSFDLTEEWEFKTHVDYKIQFYCKNLLNPSTAEYVCMETNVTFHLGKERKVFCKHAGDQRFSSSANEASMIVETTPKSKGQINCDVSPIATVQPEKVSDIHKPHEEPKELDSFELGSKDKRGSKNTTCDCGWRNKRMTRIMNGEDAGPYEFPWMAAILHKDSSYCGGAIITEYHVISAVNCKAVWLKNVNEVHVVVGINSISEAKTTGQKIQASQIVNHDYNFKLSQNVINVIVLKEKINFSLKVGPVCLPTSEPLNMYGRTVIAMGWGQTAEHVAKRIMPSLEMKLQKKELKAIASDRCSNEYGYKFDVNPGTVICAFAKDSDLCPGDNGGPLVWLDPETNRYNLVGVTARSDCNMKRPSVHTAVHYHYPWILEKIKASAHPQSNVCTKIE